MPLGVSMIRKGESKLGECSSFLQVNQWLKKLDSCRKLLICEFTPKCSQQCPKKFTELGSPVFVGSAIDCC